jgi:hypothetical protein
LQIICGKLLNFEKNGFPYGTFLIDEIASTMEDQNITPNATYSLQVIMNKLYFG